MAKPDIPANMRPTRRCNIRAVFSRFCGGILSATRQSSSNSMPASRKQLFLKVAEAFCNASGPEKTGAICYAVGWTQHSKGVQIIRSAAILQLLLGNIGRPGGGILALRGHASIQGSTDIPTLYDILPGYLPMPFFEQGCQRFQELHREAQGGRRAYGQTSTSTSSA